MKKLTFFLLCLCLLTIGVFAQTSDLFGFGSLSLNVNFHPIDSPFIDATGRFLPDSSSLRLNINLPNPVSEITRYANANTGNTGTYRNYKNLSPWFIIPGTILGSGLVIGTIMAPLSMLGFAFLDGYVAMMTTSFIIGAVGLVPLAIGGLIELIGWSASLPYRDKLIKNDKIDTF